MADLFFDYVGIITKAIDLIDDNFTAATWVKETVYSVAALVKPAAANGHYYRCTVAGTSGSSAPTFPTTIDATVADNTVTWREEIPVTITDTLEPSEGTYACVLALGIEKTSESAMIIGNRPIVELVIPLTIIIYKGGEAKTFTQMRTQAYRTLQYVEKAIRDNPSFAAYDSVVKGECGVIRIISSDTPGYYKLGLDWIIGVYVGS